MQIGMIGLGRMGANMVRRLMNDGHECVVYDLNADAIDALVEQGVFSNPQELKQPWEEAVHAFFIQAKIDTNLLDVLAIMGARKGNHTEAMGHILSEVQFMQRTYPGLQL